MAVGWTWCPHGLSDCPLRLGALRGVDACPLRCWFGRGVQTRGGPPRDGQSLGRNEEDDREIGRLAKAARRGGCKN